jgi:GntR family transcriptional regulator
MYEQLLSYFRTMIQAGVFKPGERLITEEMLCEILNISRTTVRQAMNQLAEEGLIVRYPRKGSFIADPKLKRPINELYNFTENMREIGIVPTSVILNAEVKESEEGISTCLKLPPDKTKIFHLVRLRLGNGNPILLEETYIPYYLCEGIEKIDFSNHSLYQTLSYRYALNLHRATETIEAISISQTDAKYLKCRHKAPGYRITRISYLVSGYPFEFTRSITNAEKCMFQLELYKGGNTSKNMLSFQRLVNI